MERLLIFEVSADDDDHKKNIVPTQHYSSRFVMARRNAREERVLGYCHKERKIERDLCVTRARVAYTLTVDSIDRRTLIYSRVYVIQHQAASFSCRQNCFRRIDAIRIQKLPTILFTIL